MSIDDLMLLAYVDQQLTEPDRTALEAALKIKEISYICYLLLKFSFSFP